MSSSLQGWTGQGLPGYYWGERKVYTEDAESPSAALFGGTLVLQASEKSSGLVLARDVTLPASGSGSLANYEACWNGGSSPVIVGSIKFQYSLTGYFGIKELAQVSPGASEVA